MKFIHKFSIRMSEEQRSALTCLGVKVPKGVLLPRATLPLVVVRVADDHPHWDEIVALYASWGVEGRFEHTEFSKEEVENAGWLKIGVTTHTGYPEPDSMHFGYRDVTYDMSDACPRCGIGRRQKAPYRMRGEPKWGKKGILQMNWVFDELFVPPEVYDEVFSPFGVGKQEVESSAGRTLETVVQLVVGELVDVDVAGCRSWECPECRRAVYRPATRGPFPSVVGDPDGAMVRTRQFFAPAGWSCSAVLVRADLARAIRDAGLRSAAFTPVAAEGGCMQPSGEDVSR